MEEIENCDPVEIKEKSDSDEDDHEGYFLQSTSNSYDIKEKIKEANEKLFEDYDPEMDFRERKVTFNDSVEFEQYSCTSEDDFSPSPYAVNEITDSEEPREIIVENIEELSIYQTVEEDILDEEIIEEINGMKIKEEVEIEEIEEVYEDPIPEQVEGNDIEKIEEDFGENERTADNIEEISEDTKSGDNFIEVIENNDFLDETDMEISVIHCEEETPKLRLPRKKKKEAYTPVNCRKHCLEKKDLDTINKGSEGSAFILKPSPELILRLNEKYCCKNSEKPKLPSYNGLNSEYGLTETQIQRKILKTQRKLKKNQEKILRVREEKMQRDLYNEEIFRDWLKNVSKRNVGKCKNNYKTYEERRPKSSYEARINFSWNRVRPKSCPVSKSNTIVLYPGVTLNTVTLKQNYL